MDELHGDDLDALVEAEEDAEAEAMHGTWLLEMAEDMQCWEFTFGVYPVEITV